MHEPLSIDRARPVFALAIVAVLASASMARAQDAGDTSVKTAGGMTVYVGLLPAAILRNHLPTHTEPQMHGGVPHGRHEAHLTVAVFDAAKGSRIEDATVHARISPLGLVGERKKLDPMSIAGTVTYGQFFTVPGADRYTMTVEVRRKDRKTPAKFDFPVGHVYGAGP